MNVLRMSLAAGLLAVVAACRGDGTGDNGGSSRSEGTTATTRQPPPFSLDLTREKQRAAGLDPNAGAVATLNADIEQTTRDLISNEGLDALCADHDAVVRALEISIPSPLMQDGFRADVDSYVEAHC